MTEAPSFRRSLRSAAAAGATPSGYTLTTWAGTVSASVLGAPGLLEVLLFLSGAVAAFLAVEGAAYGTVRLLAPAPAPPAVPLRAHALARRAPAPRRRRRARPAPRPRAAAGRTAGSAPA